MNSRVVELLSFLLWSAQRLTRPTFRNLTDSYEAWAYRSGFRQQVSRLAERGLIESRSAGATDRVCRLSEEGRLLALGGRDPEARWSRKWDGLWRLVMFDVPSGQDPRRERLRRYLRNHHFGFLQRSVWITPDRLDHEASLLAGATVDVESLILIEGRPCAGEPDSAIAAGAWDFARINAAYQRHLHALGECPGGSLDGVADARALQRWAMLERQTWFDAVRLDPLLPRRALPEGYLGREAWRRRVEVLGAVGSRIRAFRGA